MSTLFEIDYDLAGLYDAREELMALTIVEPAGEEQRRQDVRAVDLAISERLKDLDRKVDGIAYLCKELAARAVAHKGEGKRLTDLAKHEEVTAAEIKSRAAEVLAKRVAPEAIAAATQSSNLLKLTGQHNTLSLRKSPPALVIDDESLLPECYRRVIVKIDLQLWEDMKLCLQTENYERLAKDVRTMIEAAVSFDIETVKTAIAARLRERVPCSVCLKSMGRRIDGPGPCPECSGTGQVPATVPGARMIEDNVYLVVK